MAETKKPEKIAYVRQGRSLLTKLGIAHSGAKVTPNMISAGTPESQLTIWYRQIREDKVLELPKKLKTVLAESADGQLSLEAIFGDDSPADKSSADKSSADESPADESPADESLEDKSPEGDLAEDEKSRPRGAKRKKK
jgi:hypothetical protein